MMTPPRPRRRSRSGLWITLGIVAALLLALGGGVAFAAVQYFAPAVAAGEFCGYIKAHGYSSAYNVLSTNLKGTVSEAQFGASLSSLDSLDGAVSSCAAASGSNSYSASPFGSTAMVGMVMTRATAGALQGSLHLKKESGGWHVDAIDSGLLGTSLGALAAAESYCADLKAQQYAGAYALLGAKLQSASKQADFVQLEQWHDTVDGQVSACQPAAITTGGNDSAQSFTLSLTRAKLGAAKGALALAVESGAWKIGTVDTPLQGSDLGALQAGSRFCADLASANYADAYTLGDSTWWSGMSASKVAATLAGTSGGLIWNSCTLDASTLGTKSGYTVYKMTFTLTEKSTGQSGPVTETIAL
ncbi:MAG TPA: hypothetical protein VF120_03895, partial [Ktedonobacterales bacterium]